MTRKNNCLEFEAIDNNVYKYMCMFWFNPVEFDGVKRKGII